METMQRAVRDFQERQRAVLSSELEAVGSYGAWYDALSGFRKFVRAKYMRCRFWQLYCVNDKVPNRFGDVLDHHTVGYLAPLEFKRIGWNGEWLSPVEQVVKLSEWFASGGVRFIYACLPNKGMVYPRLICEDESVFNGMRHIAPQYRKYVGDVSLGGVEIIDLYPAFREWADTRGSRDALFSKGHEISPEGARLTGDAVADYIRATTRGISENLEIRREEMVFMDQRLAERERYFLNLTRGNEAYGSEDSDLVVFGDCNLQSYSGLGAGIGACLAQSLRHSVWNAGRMLVFDDKMAEDNEISMERLRRIRERASVVVYVAFGTAPFTRSSGITRKQMRKRPSFRYFKWCNLPLQ